MSQGIHIPEWTYKWVVGDALKDLRIPPDILAELMIAADGSKGVLLSNIWAKMNRPVRMSLEFAYSVYWRD